MTATPLDLKSFLAEIVTAKAKTLADDLGHLSAEQLSASPMGVARTPLHFVAECIGFNMLVAGALEGKPSERPPLEEREAFFASIDTLEKARRGLEASARAIASALEKADNDRLTAQVAAPWGETLLVYRLVYAAADHMAYHDGQVNYVQSLYGDAENHWG